MTNILEQPTWDDVLQVLRSDKTRSYRVDIETDSTVEPDATEEKQQTIEFMSGATQFFQGAGPIIMQAPETTGMFLEMFKQAARRFKSGRELEDKIDEATAALEAKAKQAMNAPPQQDPRIEAEKAKLELEKMKLQMEQQKMEFEIQLAQAKMQQDGQIQAQKAQSDAQIKQQTAETQAAVEMEKAQLGAQTDLAKAELGAETDIRKAEITSRAMERKADNNGG